MDVTAPVLEPPGARADTRPTRAPERLAQPRRASPEAADVAAQPRRASPEAAEVAAPREPAITARVNYDYEDARIFIEILNPRTGDVIRRLPPDLAADFALEETGRSTGIVVDRSA